MQLNLGVGNRNSDLVEGKLDVPRERKFSGKVVAGFDPGTNRKIHAVVGQFDHTHQ